MALPTALGTGERGPLRFLVVGHDRDVTRATSELIRAKGHQVEMASDAESTFSKIAQFVPDLALLDLEMPGHGGIEIGREIRRMVLPREPALVAAANWITPQVLRECAAAGFDHFLIKPPALEEIDQLADLVRISWREHSQFGSLVDEFEAQMQTFLAAQLDFCGLALDSLQHHSNQVMRERQILRLDRTIALAEASLLKQKTMPLDSKLRLKQQISGLRTRLAAFSKRTHG